MAMNVILRHGIRQDYAANFTGKIYQLNDLLHVFWKNIHLFGLGFSAESVCWRRKQSQVDKFHVTIEAEPPEMEGILWKWTNYWTGIS